MGNLTRPFTAAVLAGALRQSKLLEVGASDDTQRDLRGYCGVHSWLCFGSESFLLDNQ